MLKSFYARGFMNCDTCGQTNVNLNLERVPSFAGSTRIKQICDDCLGELQDYWDSKREESKLDDE